MSTIKSKLIAFAVVLLISFGALVYFVNSSSSHSSKAVERMILLGDIRANTNGAMMEL